MSFHYVPLGSSSHSHNKYGLQLKVASSARISQSNCYYPILEHNISPETLRGKNTWVSWASNSTLRFNVTIRINDCINGGMTKTSILRQMEDILVGAATWSELHLFVTHRNQDTIINGDETQLNAVLYLQPNLEQPPNFGLNKFPQAIKRVVYTNSCIQPPPYLPTAYIHEIDVMFEFSIASSEYGPANYILQNREALFHPTGIEHLSLDQFSKTCDRPDEAWESLDEDIAFSSQESYATCSSNSSQYTAPVNTLSKESLLPFISLVDLGFRCLICPSFRRIEPDIESNIREKKVGLAQLAPSIFSPGYSSDICRRACFIPMITRGITSIINASKSEIVKSKVTTILETYRQNYDPQGSDIRAALKTILWTKMQHDLFNPDSTRKLRRLTVPSPLTRDTIGPLHNEAAVLSDALHPNPDITDLDWYFGEESDEEYILMGEMCDGYDDGDFLCDFFDSPTLGNSHTFTTKPSEYEFSQELLAHTLPEPNIVNLDSLHNLHYSPLLDDQQIESTTSGISVDSEMEILDHSSLVIDTPQSEPLFDDDGIFMPKLDNGDMEMLLY